MCSLKFAKQKQRSLSTKRQTGCLLANWQKQNDPKDDTTKQNPFSPYAPYGRRKRRGVKSPRSRGQSCFMENNQTQRFAREGLVEKPCGKAHRQPVKEEKQTTQKSETRALYVPENRAENRAFGPKQRRNPHFIDKRKKAFYNQTVRGFRLPKKANGWDASASYPRGIWTEVCFVLRRCKRHGFCVLYAPGCRAFLGVVMNQHRKPRQCFSLAALAKCAEQNTDRASIFRKKEKPCSERLHKN